MAGKPEAKPEEGAAPPPPKAPSGGAKAWIPLLANLILMPVMGYVTIAFLAPKNHDTAAATESASGSSEKTEKPEKAAKGEGKGAVEGDPDIEQLGDKIIANLQGTQGSRLVIARIALSGTNPKFKDAVAKHDFALRDVANSILGGKTIVDIDKPGAKNLIRAELQASFNKILGEGMVKEVYLVEFAMQ